MDRPAPRGAVPSGAGRLLVVDDSSRTRPVAVLTRHFDGNASAILYGSVLAAAAMTVVGVQPDRTGAIALSVVLMLVVYSLAHLYATVLGSRITQPGAPAWLRIRANLPHEAAVIEGGLPVLLCFIGLRVAGVGVPDAALGASWLTVALMAFIGYRIGRLSGATGPRLALEVTAAAGIGVLLIALKTALY